MSINQLGWSTFRHGVSYSNTPFYKRFSILKTTSGCVCTAPCNTGDLPKLGEACSTDGTWTCQKIENSSGTYDFCTHSDLNLCQAG